MTQASVTRTVVSKQMCSFQYMLKERLGYKLIRPEENEAEPYTWQV